MPKHLIRKLEHFARLSGDDKRALDDVASKNIRVLDARQDLAHEGDRPTYVNLILEKFAARYKSLEDGRIQILDILVPGDMCDLRVFILRRRDHSIEAPSRVKLAQISEQQLQSLIADRPRLERALTWTSLVNESISREWTERVDLAGMDRQCRPTRGA